MGFVHHPLRLDTLMAMPLDQRRKAIESEVAFLRGVHRRQGSMLAWLPVLVVAILLLMVIVA